MKAALGPEMLQRVAAQFRALAEPSRLQLMQMLADGERGVGELAAATGLGLANASKQLGLLHRAGWLLRRKDGQAVRYALADPTAVQLCELMCDRVRQRAAAELALTAASSRRRSRA